MTDNAAHLDDNEIISVGMPLPRIAAVEPLGGYQLRVTWNRGRNAGSTETISTAPAIFSHRAFIPLRDDPTLFDRVSIVAHGSAVAFPLEGTELAAEWLDRLPRSGMTNREFRELMDSRLHYSLDGMAAALGIARRRIAEYRKDTPVPPVVALATRQLVAEVDRSAA